MNPPALPRPHRHTPDKDDMAALEPFERLDRSRITLVATGAAAEDAAAVLSGAAVCGFDTESKPTFVRHEVSTGPHVLQLALAHHAWVFQLHDPACCAVVGELLTRTDITKAGFGLGDDRRRIVAKLGVEPAGVLELNTVLRQRGYRREMGVRAAVAALFNRRFIKSRKASTSNWASPNLSDAQLLYAANDAWAALRVWQALHETGAGVELPASDFS
jgi:ribonuclease D